MYLLTCPLAPHELDHRPHNRHLPLQLPYPDRQPGRSDADGPRRATGAGARGARRQRGVCAETVARLLQSVLSLFADDSAECGGVEGEEEAIV